MSSHQEPAAAASMNGLNGLNGSTSAELAVGEQQPEQQQQVEQPGGQYDHRKVEQFIGEFFACKAAACLSCVVRLGACFPVRFCTISLFFFFFSLLFFWSLFSALFGWLLCHRIA